MRRPRCSATSGRSRTRPTAAELVDVADMPRQINAVVLPRLQRGWAAGNGFFHTTDGGATWDQDSSWGTIYDVYFLDAKYGWAAGNGAVTYYTTDGGLNWDFVQTGGGSTMKTIFFADRRNGWAADLDGEIFHSTDGGRSWDLQDDRRRQQPPVDPVLRPRGRLGHRR